MQNRVVLAITGASGSIYAKLLIEKLMGLKSQWQDLSVVMTENAKTVWQTEILLNSLLPRILWRHSPRVRDNTM
jgi:3-polyprenyl-4-hydroxybenzoate decarboxylase